MTSGLRHGVTSRFVAWLFGFLSGSSLCLCLVLVRFTLITTQATDRPAPLRVFEPSQSTFSNRAEGEKPTLWIVGDETWAYGGLTVPDKSRGIGDFLHEYFSLPIQNRAIGGRSARSYTAHGDWLRLRFHLQPGDYVLLSFGNNDFGDPIHDRWNRTALDTDDLNAFVEGFNGETVVSWISYMQAFVRDIRDASAIPILSTSPAFNSWDTKDNPPYYWPGPDPIPTWLLPKLAEWEELSWVDIWSPLAQVFRDLGFVKASSFQEDIHGVQVWNAEGARVATETWVNALRCSNGKEVDSLKQYLSSKALRLPALC